MKRMTTCVLPIVLLLFVGTPTYSAERENGQEASEDAAPKPDAQIVKWISQLDSDAFFVRLGDSFASAMAELIEKQKP